MELEEAILSRHSVKVFDTREVPREWIERCLELAAWAPNHKLTEPWRFFVLSGEARGRLADALEAEMESDGMDGDSAHERAERERKKFEGAPTLIVVYSDHGDNEKVTRENNAATSAAVQNLLLAAHAKGLGAIWRTNDHLNGKFVKNHLGAPVNSDFSALVYMGFSAQRDMVRKRTPAAEKTRWLTD